MKSEIFSWKRTVCGQQAEEAGVELDAESPQSHRSSLCSTDLDALSPDQLAHKIKRCQESLAKLMTSYTAWSNKVGQHNDTEGNTGRVSCVVLFYFLWLLTESSTEVGYQPCDVLVSDLHHGSTHSPERLKSASGQMKQGFNEGAHYPLFCHIFSALDIH